MGVSGSAFFMLHLGKLIQTELARQERTPIWLARKICCDRTNVHKIFRRASLDTVLLARISRALEHNFFEDLAEDWRSGE